MRIQQIYLQRRGPKELAHLRQLLFNDFRPSWSSARSWTSAGGELLGCPNRKKTLSCRTSKDVLHLAQRSFYKKKCKLELERLMTIDPVRRCFPSTPSEE